MNAKRKQLTSAQALICLSVLYVVVSVMMNIFCMKPLSFGSSIIVCDAGLLISWLVFLFLNIVVEVWDEKTAMMLVKFAALVSFCVMVLSRIIVFIPSLPEYEEQVSAFALVFSNGPRTIIASVLAFLIGNSINSHIIYTIKTVLERKNKDNKVLFFLRAVFSSLVGQLADNSAFMLLAFAPVGLSVYEMPLFDIFTAVLSGTVIELVVESLCVPFITMPLTRKIKAIKEAEAA